MGEKPLTIIECRDSSRTATSPVALPRAQVAATVHAVNLAAVDSALTAGNAATQLDAALRKQLGASLGSGTLKVRDSAACALRHA